MKIDRRITNGLAWAGVVLVIGVPVADVLSARFMGEPTARIAAIEPVEAPVPAPEIQRPEAPISAPEAASPAESVAAGPAGQGDVVDSFLRSGRQLPSYITGGDAPAAVTTPAPAQPTMATPAPAQPPASIPPAIAAPAAAPAPAPAATVPDPVAVAAIPAKVAPIPMPLSMRPRPVSQPIAEVPAPVVIPPGVAAPVELTAADLEDWESGPLSEFLANRQQQAGGSGGEADYDPNGFYLDQGPNQPRNRVIGREAPIFFGN